VGPILRQLGLDHTFFIQFAMIAALYFILSRIFFRPFQQLIERRHARTVEDRKAAEELLQQAQEKMNEYQRRLTEERKLARAEIDQAIQAAKKEESALLQAARDEAKSITQGAIANLEAQREKIRKELHADVEEIAQLVTEKLMVK
jgi:F-type H+-transporting ATPase subunit b